MPFSTSLFLCYFLPVVLAVYYALPVVTGAANWSNATLARLRNAWLLLASCVFYGRSDPRFVWLLLLIAWAIYGCGRYIGRTTATARQRWWGAAVAVAASLSVLGFFKYFIFFQTNLNDLRSWLGADTVYVLQVALPLGISFYTFKAISYIVDVYRGVVPPTKSLLDFATYLALFPQLTAGPIVRYETVSRQLVDRRTNWEQVAAGVSLFILGLAKKVLLADSLRPAADTAFGAEVLACSDAWFGALAYSLQIYFDFSGYSDMAVGLGRMLGFECLRNFDAPYRAQSPSDFWHRWHISLSTFLRDYLYIPLGGNRKGTVRTYFNLALVMLLGGLWHGANWTFVAWGAYHGLLLIGERLGGKDGFAFRLPRPLRAAATFVLVLFSWVLFRSGTLTQAIHYTCAMLGPGAEDASLPLLAAQLYTPTCLWAMAVGSLVILLPSQAHDWSTRLTWPRLLLLLSLFCLSLCAMRVQVFSPFLYARF